MARLTVEQKWWSDPRRSFFMSRISKPEFADGVMIHLWRVAQEYWAEDSLLPMRVFNKILYWEQILESDLAELRTGPELDSNTMFEIPNSPEQISKTYVYVRGSKDFFSWIKEIRESRKLGGQKSAEARKQKYGSAQPKKDDSRTNSELTSNSARTESNSLEVSGSGSGSDSGSCNKVLKLKVGSTPPPENPPDLPKPDSESFNPEEKLNAEEHLDFASAFGSKGSCKVIDPLKGYPHLECALSWVPRDTQRRWVHSYTDTFELRKSLAKGVEHISSRLNERDRSTPTKWGSWLDGWLSGEKKLIKGMPGDNSAASSMRHITEEGIFGKVEGEK